MITREQFEKIMGDEDNTGSKFLQIKDDNAFLGLQIIRKYCPNKGIEGANLDTIYSVSVLRRYLLMSITTTGMDI